jgi:AraC family transcriptional regulator
MIAQIRTLPEKKLIGLQLSMSMAENRTGELWCNFMMRRKEIQKATGTDLYSIQVYPPDYFSAFSPVTGFTKWAAAEVSDLENMPDGIDKFHLSGGLYAVLLYRGDPRSGAQTFQYIYGTWLPNSDYELDDRPHFEILEEKYKNDSPDSEEEIWLPVKPKL